MLERNVNFRATANEVLEVISNAVEASTSQLDEFPLMDKNVEERKNNKADELKQEKKEEVEEGGGPLINRIPDLSYLYVNPKEEEKEEEENEVMIPDHLKYIPMETLENGAIRRKKSIPKSIKRKRQSPSERFLAALRYYASRVLYFLSKFFSLFKICLRLGLLSSSVLYVLIFLIIGLGALSFFLFLSYCIVLFFRYLIQLRCECDLAQPQYLIISGILLILLFALLFR